jgi:hypothetical protein
LKKNDQTDKIKPKAAFLFQTGNISANLLGMGGIFDSQNNSGLFSDKSCRRITPEDLGLKSVISLEEAWVNLILTSYFSLG